MFFYEYQKAYFKRRYLKLPPKIYYNRRFKAYVNPKIIDELDDELYVCSEIVYASLFYKYEIEGKDEHAHCIEEVLIDAYNYAETFFIHKDWKDQYSFQELNLINKLVNQGKFDRKDLE